MSKVSVTLLGTAQDGGVPQAGCACPRCMAVHEGKSPELYPVSIGIVDEEGGFHLVEASRTIGRQLRLWANSHSTLNLPIVSPLTSVSLTHLHLGHIDGLGQFGRESMGYNQNLRLIASPPVLTQLDQRCLLTPFRPDPLSSSSDPTTTTTTTTTAPPPTTPLTKTLTPNLTLEFHRVPHRDHEPGDTHAILIRGPNRSLLFLPDHDTWDETLSYHHCISVREWIVDRLKVDVALLDGTFWKKGEVGGHRADGEGIPHPPIEETLGLLGERRKDGEKEKEDLEVCFVHLNHTNPVVGVEDEEGRNMRKKVEDMGWSIGTQGQVWYL